MKEARTSTCLRRVAEFYSGFICSDGASEILNETMKKFLFITLVLAYICTFVYTASILGELSWSTMGKGI